MDALEVMHRERQQAKRARSNKLLIYMYDAEAIITELEELRKYKKLVIEAKSIVRHSFDLLKQERLCKRYVGRCTLLDETG